MNLTHRESLRSVSLSFATCWNVSPWQQRGSGDTDLPEVQQGMKVLGTPLGHPSFVEAQLTEQRTFLERIPEVEDLQSAWSLLVHSASMRANCLLRVVEQSVVNYAGAHDDGMWRCFCRILRIDVVQEEHFRSAAGMPLVLGGLRLRSAVWLSRSAFWASWADCLPMVLSRHRDVATRFVVNLEGAPDTPSLGAAASAMWSLTGSMGFGPPSWRALAEGARPEKGSVRRGWQHEAASRVDRHFRECCLTGYLHVTEFRCVPRRGQAPVWR